MTIYLIKQDPNRYLIYQSPFMYLQMNGTWTNNCIMYNSRRFAIQMLKKLYANIKRVKDHPRNVGDQQEIWEA